MTGSDVRLSGLLALVALTALFTTIGCRTSPSSAASDASSETATSLGESSSLGEQAEPSRSTAVTRTASGVRGFEQGSSQTRRAVATDRDVENSDREFMDVNAETRPKKLSGSQPSRPGNETEPSGTDAADQSPRSGNRWSNWVRGWAAPSRNTIGRTLPRDSRPGLGQGDGETAEGF